MELNFSMVDVSLAVSEAPNQTGAMHLRAYATGLLHKELKNIKAFVGLRDICLYKPAWSLLHLRSPTSGFLNPRCTAGAKQLWAV